MDGIERDLEGTRNRALFSRPVDGIEQEKSAASAPLLLGSVADVARSLSVSESTVKRIIARGDLPSVKIEKRRLVPWAAVREFVAARVDDGGGRGLTIVN